MNRLLSIAYCLLLTGYCLFFTACSRRYDPKQTYSVEQIRQDFDVMKNALEEAHPGLYRYTSPDSIRWIFDQTAQQLNRPMTEREFRRVTNPIFAYVRCGHTDIYPSKGYTKYIKKNKPKEFPLMLYYLQNKLLILQNNTDDSTLTVSTEVMELDGQPVAKVVEEMRRTIPSDGYNQTFKNAMIAGGFGAYYRYLYGNKDTFQVMVKDSLGKQRKLNLTFTKPPKTTPKAKTKPANTATPKPPVAPVPRPIVKTNTKLRTLKISEKDSSVAILDINTFSGNKYQRFYRRAFKAIKAHKIKHLIIDLRANGGGKSDASINLMSYLLDSNYVVYDTIVAIKGKPTFNSRYGHKFHRLFTRIFSVKKTSDGMLVNKATAKAHKPNKKYGFKGNVYLLTNGRSFSAASIFPSIVQQYSPRAVVVGRETGGGKYGCNAFISPYLTLPNTKAKVRIPMFKIILHVPGRDQGRGVMPNHAVEYTFDDVRQNRDLDMLKVYELIKSGKSEK